MPSFIRRWRFAPPRCPFVFVLALVDCPWVCPAGSRWVGPWLRRRPINFGLRLRLRRGPTHSRLGLDLGIRLGSLVRLRRSVVLAELSDGLATIGDLGSLTLAGSNSLAGLSAGGPPLWFPAFAAPRGISGPLALLSELLSLYLVHRLESQRTVLVPSPLVERRGHHGAPRS